MSAEDLVVERSARDRPLGLAPRGSAWGLGAIATLCMVAPTAAVFSAADWEPLSLDGLLGSAFGSIVFSFVGFIPLAAGLQTRRFWGVCWYFAAGMLSAIVYIAAVVIALAGFLHIFTVAYPDRIGLAWLGRLFILACTPMLLPLWRGLRLRYWQPWSPPGDWEGGDEHNARWASQLAGAPPARRSR